jgi:hypothetical protein
VISSRAPRYVRRRAQQGYAFLLVVFFMTVLLVSSMAIGPSIVTNGRREKEEELIWRGNQYVRGIKLFYRKMGRFPTTVDDLTKPQVGSLRFMRQAFKDPMNKEDGSWRLLYVGPTGQLVGSLKPPQNNLQMPGQGFGTPVAAMGGAAGGVAQQSGGFGSPSQPVTTPPGMTPGTQLGQPTGTPAPGANGTDPTNGQNDPMLNPPADSGFGSTVIGGNIIGVGSKVNQRSLRVYEKAKNYKLFEFYWDPSKDMAAAVQSGMQPGTIPGASPVTPTTPGMSPGGNSNPGGGFGGTPQPPTQAPQPTPQQ